MICEGLNLDALSELSDEYSVRNCRPDELGIWKAFPFDEVGFTEEYSRFMTKFFEETYGGKEDLFFAKTLFVCDKKDTPLATCFTWKAYNKFNTVQWFKVLKSYEGRGIGRALLSIVMGDLKQKDYPIYLHTQPASYRAIKLYSDFGFALLAGDNFGIRPNDLDEYLPILEQFMPEKDFNNLKITKASKEFEDFLGKQTTIQS